MKAIDATFGNSPFGVAPFGGAESRLISNIDADNAIQVGQLNVSITALNLDISPTTQIVTLGGESLTVVNWNGGNPTVTIPVNIALKPGRNDLQLAVTDDTGTAILDNVTLLPEAGWEYVDFSGTIPAANTESGYEVVQADYAYDMVAGDQWLFKSEIGLSFNVDTVVALNPQRTITTEYRVWNDALGTMSAKTSYDIVQKPKLSSGGFTGQI